MGFLVFLLLLGVGFYEMVSRVLEHRVRMAAIDAAKELALAGKAPLMLPESDDDEEDDEDEEDEDAVPIELVEAYRELREEFPDRN